MDQENKSESLPENSVTTDNTADNNTNIPASANIPLTPPQNPAQVISSPPEKSKHNWLISVMIIVVILIGSLSIYFAYKKYQSRENENTTLKITPTEITNSPTPTVDPISNWKTYTNTKYSFLLKYPPEFILKTEGYERGEEEMFEITSDEVEPQTIMLVGVSSSDFDKKVYEDTKSKSGETVSGEFPGSTNKGTVSVSETSVSGIIAYQIRLESETSVLTNIYFEKNGFYYQLSFVTGNKEHEKTFDQILSTFRFLDENNDNVVNFSSCVKGNTYHQDHGLGSNTLTIKESKAETCLIEYTNELEGGYNTYECDVPKSTPSIIFPDVSSIEKFCNQTKSGNVLMEQ